jgi:hypothetical protein
MTLDIYGSHKTGKLPYPATCLCLQPGIFEPSFVMGRADRLPELPVMKIFHKPLIGTGKKMVVPASRQPSIATGGVATDFTARR